MRMASHDKGDALDVVQARRLADLISSNVAHLESLTSLKPPGKGEEGKERETILTITSAATQLAALLRPPAQVILEIATGFTLSAALRLVVEAHVPEIIRALSTSATPNQDNGVPVSDISALCGVAAPKVERILRLLATHHIFAEHPSSSLFSDTASNGDARYNSDSSSFGRRPCSYTSPSPLFTSHTRPRLPTDDHSGIDQFEQSEQLTQPCRACFVGEGELCTVDVEGEEGGVENANAAGGATGEARVRTKVLGGEARFMHTRLSEVLDSGVDLELLEPDVDPAVLPDRLSSFLTTGEGKKMEMEVDGKHGGCENEERMEMEMEVDGKHGGCENEERMEMEINVGKEGEDERRKKRWATKYGAEAPGAGLAALVGILTDESMFHMTALTELLLDSRHRQRRSQSGSELESLTSSLVPPSAVARNPDAEVSRHPESKSSNSEDSEDSPLHTAFSLSRGFPQTTMFEWLSAGGNAHRLHRFGCAMRGMGSLTPEGAILKGFDFASLAHGSSIVDVGGGVGAASLPILRAYPHLRLVVQDTAEVVGVAPGFWEAQYPEAICEGRVRFQVQSFFDAQPPLVFESNELNNGVNNGKGEGGGGVAPDVFLLRMIMHNWPDAECLRILRRLREASGEGTRLVLVDSVLMAACRERRGRGGLAEPEVDANRDDDKVGGVARAGATLNAMEMKMMKEAPEPLLANWGAANGLAYRLDLIMLANHNACERTLPAFNTLLSRSGWAIREVYAASESWMPQIVAVPVPVPVPVSVPGYA